MSKEIREVVKKSQEFVDRVVEFAKKLNDRKFIEEIEKKYNVGFPVKLKVVKVGELVRDESRYFLSDAGLEEFRPDLVMQARAGDDMCRRSFLACLDREDEGISELISKYIKEWEEIRRPVLPLTPIIIDKEDKVVAGWWLLRAFKELKGEDVDLITLKIEASCREEPIVCLKLFSIFEFPYVNKVIRSRGYLYFITYAYLTKVTGLQFSLSDIAEIYGVTRQAVSDAVRRFAIRLDDDYLRSLAKTILSPVLREELRSEVEQIKQVQVVVTSVEAVEAKPEVKPEEKLAEVKPTVEEVQPSVKPEVKPEEKPVEEAPVPSTVAEEVAKIVEHVEKAVAEKAEFLAELSERAKKIQEARKEVIAKLATEIKKKIEEERLTPPKTPEEVVKYFSEGLENLPGELSMLINNLIKEADTNLRSVCKNVPCWDYVVNELAKHEKSGDKARLVDILTKIGIDEEKAEKIAVLSILALGDREFRELVRELSDCYELGLSPIEILESFKDHVGDTRTLRIPEALWGALEGNFRACVAEEVKVKLSEAGIYRFVKDWLRLAVRVLEAVSRKYRAMKYRDLLDLLRAIIDEGISRTLGITLT